ncbi:fam-d protein [Plasmodium yoelii]|uniref:Fam-d protein n=3 Tax=Plasmodium yoelii TaxID=5861 RepID=Q7RMG4_PLAYO|nr:fam-d protein [Plasmodium yoelii]EAA21649.1 hypothetical protein [Plasmodium yoelii yoelii]CDU17981.1 fam-d protein [Plasmodium yoelii]VTZ78398.1 fam-d protein [Plasmodium yoelii]|eukprot:XP_730084.1 fam-d protein [Plasmodium yoelii]
MMNIILSFFILLISVNVKGATFQDENNNIPKPIAYESVSQPNAMLIYDNKGHNKYLNAINDTFCDQSKNTKYAYEGGNYHLVITGFDISLDNSSYGIGHYFSKKKLEALKLGTKYFISYLKDRFRYLMSRYMYKYDFETNYATDLTILVDDLKSLIYDRFNYELKHNHIKIKKEPEDEKLKKRSRDIFKILVQCSAIRLQGYIIKTIKDEDQIYLSKESSLYFTIALSNYQSRATYDFKFPEYEIVEADAKSLRKS